MSLNYKTVKAILEAYTEALVDVVGLLPQHGDTEETCQRMALVNTLNRLAAVVEGFEDADLEFEGSQHPERAIDMERFINEACDQAAGILLLIDEVKHKAP